jgi:hypothetical protein
MNRCSKGPGTFTAGGGFGIMAVMKKISGAAVLFALILAACNSGPQPEKPAAAAGVLTVTGIPAAYMGGIILASGSGENGDTFTYSPKVLQRVSETRLEIKIYEEVSMIQKPFAGSGNYLVSVELHREGDPNDFERRYFKRKFSEGRAEINWSEGSLKPPPAP